MPKKPSYKVAEDGILEPPNYVPRQCPFNWGLSCFKEPVALPKTAQRNVAADRRRAM